MSNGQNILLLVPKNNPKNNPNYIVSHGEKTMRKHRFPAAFSSKTPSRGAHVRDSRRETFGFGRYVPSRAAAAMWSLLKAEIYAKEADYVAWPPWPWADLDGFVEDSNDLMGCGENDGTQLRLSMII